MDSKNIRIVFMGTPEFAVGSLRALVEGGYNVVGVVTMPDKPAGRGHKIQFSDVKQYALEHNLPLLQPEKLKDETFLQQLREWNADLQIVVAFRMLPEVVWSMPKLGTFNLHGSLLPQYRGAAPINWAIINGDTVTGVTTFMLDKDIDTGNIILQESTPIAPEDNIGTVYDRLMQIGSKLVTRTVDIIASGDVHPLPQNNDISLRPAPKIFKDTCRLSFGKPVEQVHNLVRGLSPYPAAWFEFEDSKGETKTMKVYETFIDRSEISVPVGTVVTDGKKTLKIACADGYLCLKSVQLSGKRRMDVQELLCGAKMNDIKIITE